MAHVSLSLFCLQGQHDALELELGVAMGMWGHRGGKKGAIGQFIKLEIKDTVFR